MAEIKISELPAADPLDGSEEFPVVQSGQTRRATIDNATLHQGALVRLTANQSIADNSATVVSWDAAEYDDLGFWDSGQPTRLTVPSGVSKVRVSSNVRWANQSTGLRTADHLKNGVIFRGMGVHRQPAAQFSEHNIHSAVVEVVAGDYFEARVHQTSGGTLDVQAHEATWFAIEVIE